MSLFYNVNFLGFFYADSYQIASFDKPTSSDIHRMKFRLLDNIDKTSNLYCRGLHDVHVCISPKD